MTTVAPLRFHSLHGRVVLSQGNTRAQCVKPNNWSPMNVMFIIGGRDLVCYGTELVFSHRPIVAGEMIRLRFGPSVDQTRKLALLGVLVGVTNRSPNNTRQAPSASDVKNQPGYWLLEQLTNNESSLQFCVSEAGDLLSYDSQGNVKKGPNLGQDTGPLWAVVVVPEYPFIVEIDSTLPRVNSAAVSQSSCLSSALRGATAAYSTLEGASESPNTTSQSRQGRTAEGNGASAVDKQNCDKSECIICYDKPPDTAFSPCGHMYTCYNCALDLWQGSGRGTCPSCRKPITSVLRIYRD